MNYNKIPTVLARHSFHKKMQICFLYSQRNMNIENGIVGPEELHNRALPWELETFLMLSVKSIEWKEEDFSGKNFKKFIEIINCIKDFQHASLMPGGIFRIDLFMIGTALTQFDVQEFWLYRLYRYNYFFEFTNTKVNMPSEFINKFGCQFNDFLRLGYFLHFFIALKCNVPKEIFKYIFWKFKDVIEKLKMTRQEYIETLDKITKKCSDYVYCLRPSYAFPFLEYNGKIYLPLPHLILRAVTSSLMYRLTGGNDKLANIIGKEVLESYLLSILQNSSVYDELYPEFDYFDGKNKKKTIDYMLRKENEYLFLDSKSTKPSLGIRTFDQSSIERNIDIIAAGCEQMYKHLICEFQDKYNPFANKELIKRENLWGIVVVCEDSFIMREKIYESAAEKLGIKLDSEEYKWLSLHIGITQLYEIEKCCFVGEDLIKHMKKHAETGRCNDFILADGLENNRIINRELLHFQKEVASQIGSLSLELQELGIIQKDNL